MVPGGARLWRPLGATGLPTVATSDPCATLKMPRLRVRVRTRPSGAVKYEVLSDFASCLLSHAVRSLWGCTSPPTECAGPYHSLKRSRERPWRGSLARQLPLLTRGY